jgi:transcriptional regulator with XRE-family HTH domain
MTFGEFVKNMRERKELALREFCRLATLDPSNWSKIERGLLPPPKSRQQLNDIATVLMLPRESEEYNTLFDLAAISHVPKELMPDGVAENLVVYFRAARGSASPAQTMGEIKKIFKQGKKKRKA